MNRAILDRQMFAGGGAAFPDLSGDGRITQKDILMGKGVIPMAGGGNPMARGEQIKYYENGGGPETLVRGILGSILESAGSGALDNLGRGAVENLISQAVKLGGLGAGETMAVILNNQYGAREKDTTGAFLEIQRQIQEQQEGAQYTFEEDGQTVSRGFSDSVPQISAGALKNNSRFALSDMEEVNRILPKISAGALRPMVAGALKNNPRFPLSDMEEVNRILPMGLEAASPMVGATPRTRAIKRGGRMGGIPMAEGGMVQEGVGSLMAQETMPSPEAAMEDAVMGAAEGIGALDAAQDYEQAINSVRGDQMPIEARYEELASFVGPEDAAQTPESVLALVQPVLEMAEIDQGIGSIAPEAMGGDAPMTPEMAGGIMSNVPEAVPMEGPPENFSQGGVARLKNDQIRYYADGGVVQHFQPGGVVNRDDLYETTRERYLKTLGEDNEVALSDAQRMAKSQMLFDIADTALRFASTPVGPGESVASTLAKSATESQLFPKIGLRAKSVQDLKTSQAKDARALNLAALQRSEQLGDAQIAAIAKAAAEERASLDKPLKDTYEIIVNGETILTLPLATMRDRRDLVKRLNERFGPDAVINIKKLVEKDKTSKIKNVLSADGKISLGTFDVNNPTQLEAMRDIINTNPGAYAVDGGPKPKETATQNYQLPDGSITTAVVGSLNAEKLRNQGAIAVSDDKPYDQERMERTQITLLKDVIVNGITYKKGTHPNFNNKELSKIAKTVGADAYTNYEKPITDKDYFDKFKMSKAAFEALSLENQQFLQGLPVLTDKDYFSKFGMTSAEFNQSSDFDKKVLLGIQPKYKYITSTDNGVTTTYRIDESNPDNLHEVVQGTDQKEYTYQTIKDGDTTRLLRFEKGSNAKPVEVASGTDTEEYFFREFKDGKTTKLVRFKKNDPNDQGTVVMTGEDAPEYDFREIKDGDTIRFIRTDKATGEVFEVLSATDTTKPSYMSITLPDANNNLITTTVDVTTEAGRNLITKANKIREGGGNASVRKLSSEKNTAQPYYNTDSGEIVISYDGKTYLDENETVKTLGDKFLPTDKTLTYEIYKREKISADARRKLAELDDKAASSMLVPVYDENGKAKLDEEGVPIKRKLTEEEVMSYKNILGKVRTGTGFWSKIYAGIDGVLGGVFAPDYFAELFKDTTDGRMLVESLRVMGRSALSSSPRYAVADLETVEKLFPSEKEFFRNPVTMVRKLKNLDQALTEEKYRLLKLQEQTLDSTILGNAMSKVAEIEKLQSIIGPIANLTGSGVVSNKVKTRQSTINILKKQFE